ncbi:MAG: von Willebrand factor type A domain-containing protein [Lentisphaeria bacterium]|nr:von Willebrand factor type A domain-containing protein [Lentisphaeria bacterium]
MKDTPEKKQLTCAAIENLLGAYVFADLSAADSARVENHLEVCAACRAEVAAMRQVVQALKDELAAEDAPVLSGEFHQRLAALPAAPPARKSILGLPASRVILQVAATFVGLAALWMFIIPGLFTAERHYSKTRLDKCARMNDDDIPLEYNAYPAGTFDTKELDPEAREELTLPAVAPPPLTMPAPPAAPAPESALDFDGDDTMETRRGARPATEHDIILPGLSASRLAKSGSGGVGKDKSAVDFSDEVFDQRTDGANTVTRFEKTKKETSFTVLTDGTDVNGKKNKPAGSYPYGGKVSASASERGVGGALPAPRKSQSEEAESFKWRDAEAASKALRDEGDRRKGDIAAGPEPKPADAAPFSVAAATAEPSPDVAGVGRFRIESEAKTRGAGVEKTLSLTTPLPKTRQQEAVAAKDSEREYDDGEVFLREAGSKTGTVASGEDLAGNNGRLLKQAIDEPERAKQPSNLPPSEKEEAQRLPLDGLATRVTELPAAHLEAVQEAWFKPLPVNPFQLTAQDNQSTFALDTDTASYRIAQNYLRNNQLPPGGAIRMEEFVNAFDYNYPRGDQVFTIHVEGAPSPFRKNLTLLKIGIQGKIIGREARKNGRFVFLIDTSGSMARHDRMPLVIHSIELLLNQLDERDTLSVITYGPEPALILDAASPREKQRILDTLKAIQCGGATNLYKGVLLAYETARRQFQAQAVNRIVLFSDGATNVGPTDAADLLSQVSANRRQGINFTSIGFGLGDYNDEILEALANKGDGNYLFVGTPEEARQALVENMGATAQHIAKDAKIQVEFNKDIVRRYRLIGYENRDIADKDFRNDSVDAGEVASGQSATALYEVELLERTDPEFNPDLGTVYVRYRDMETYRIEEISRRISPDAIQNLTVKKAPRFFLAAGAAEFAEQLRGSEHVQGSAVSDVRHLLEHVAVELPLDTGIQTLLNDVRQAEKLTGRSAP